jgi:hypothetical protein
MSSQDLGRQSATDGNSKARALRDGGSGRQDTFNRQFGLALRPAAELLAGRQLT